MACRARRKRAKEVTGQHIGCIARCVHFTASDGIDAYEEREYEIPDERSVGRPCSSYYVPSDERCMFDGWTTDYLRASVSSYCVARAAATEVAEGIGQTVPDHDSK